ncbi:asparaginyl-tRNA synthetase [Ophiobolus disseminans]|uniref:Asparaginyl-tRNA synthetase n=1 Tax=Ophiobolus disseminans TaxID=1469910 RepID=A0A6A6ZTJ1_9PLEO|nr:asparaginyl-tRNA synthetase [Ophiobolus disseminans]
MAGLPDSPSVFLTVPAHNPPFHHQLLLGRLADNTAVANATMSDQFTVYIDPLRDSDENIVTGTKESPFCDIFSAFLAQPPESRAPPPEFLKVVSRYDDHIKKVRKLEEEEVSRQAALVEGRKFILKPDSSLPAPINLKNFALHQDHVNLGNDSTTGTRVRVVGRVDNIRTSKTRSFVYLTDTRGLLLCIFSGNVNKVIPVLLQKQASIEVIDEMKEDPPENHAPDNRELHVDFYAIIGEAPGGPDSFTTKVPASANQSVLSDYHHLVLHRSGESIVMKARASALAAFRKYYDKHDMREHTAPSFVQTQVEGGGSLFQVPCYGETAYLTQTSQLYLETQLPILGDCYTIQSFFRAEKSLTRRHLSEYTHIEGELNFITFEDLLDRIEDLFCGVIDILLADPESASYIESLNPGFKAPARPFRRMRYTEAIQWLNEHAEAAERAMTDSIGVPIMLTHFLGPIKAFYMKKDADDLRLTEASIDNGWNTDAYAFYSAQRKYGTSPHGGYGMGLERFLVWILKRYTVRECVPYPRYPGRW